MNAQTIRPGLYLGLMSGTSLDGIDAALVEIDGRSVTLVAARESPWPEDLRNRLLELRETPQLSLQTLGELDHRCGAGLADAALALLEEAGVTPDRVTAIGSHGQTIHHHPHPPTPFSLQIGDPSLIAQRTGITTVADFRRRDLAAGGQGAPLVPPFHKECLWRPGRHRAVLNIGGIANLTALPADGTVTAGFDTGPGNCLLDSWIRRHLGRPYDRDGRWAAGAEPDAALLARLLDDPYFRQAPPKSTGTEYFSLNWLAARLGESRLDPQVVQATLLALTVATVAEAVKRWLPETEELLVCGGGRHNGALMAALTDALAPVEVAGTERAGLDPDWVEAMAFAWLAARTLAGLPGNLPTVTGAREAVVLGAVYPG